MLTVAGADRLFLDYACRTKAGIGCRAVFSIDAQGSRIPQSVLDDLDRELAACLGRGWTKRIPAENPFG